MLALAIALVALAVAMLVALQTPQGIALHHALFAVLTALAAALVFPYDRYLRR